MSSIDALLAGFANALQPVTLMWGFVGCFVGTLVGVLRTFRMATDAAATTATPTAPVPVAFRFGEVWTQPIVLRGIAQVFALNANGASFASGTTLSCWVEWSE